MQKILVTGSRGQIGSELVPKLKAKYGQQNVIELDMQAPGATEEGIYFQQDVLDREALEKIIVDHNIDTVYHLACILSAAGEKKPRETWKVNGESLQSILDLAVTHQFRIFWPSSIAAFGPGAPKHNTPQEIQFEAPETMYGITKQSGEALCAYYHKKYGVDVRSVRYPGIISWKTEPGGGTTDYAVAVFYEGLKSGHYDYFVHESTALPMMYMDDAITAALQIMEAPAENIKIRLSYNLAAVTFTAQELTREIQKHIPLQVTYSPDFRQAIADSWPDSIDDSAARADWGWEHQFDLEKMTVEMLEKLKLKFNS